VSGLFRSRPRPWLGQPGTRSSAASSLTRSLAGRVESVRGGDVPAPGGAVRSRASEVPDDRAEEPATPLRRRAASDELPGREAGQARPGWRGDSGRAWWRPSPWRRTHPGDSPPAPDVRAAKPGVPADQAGPVAGG
jgi:hypothetical protein